MGSDRWRDDLTGAPVLPGEACEMGKCEFFKVKKVKAWVLKGSRAGGRERAPGSGRTDPEGGTSSGRPDRPPDSQVPRRPPGEPGNVAKARRKNLAGVPGVRPPCRSGWLCRFRGGCLRVGTRVRMESRVVGAAGFRVGATAGAQGSPGPRGEPGKEGPFLSAL